MKKYNKKVVYWLFSGCALIFIMVVVGGITRLTHSGLSMPDYKIISGTIPPINAEQWNEAFELYKSMLAARSEQVTMMLARVELQLDKQQRSPQSSEERKDSPESGLKQPTIEKTNEAYQNLLRIV